MKAFIFIPGLIIKRANPCVDPQQSQMPHIVKVIHISDDGTTIIKTLWEPNSEDYPEYEYIINKCIEKEKLND